MYNPKIVLYVVTSELIDFYESQPELTQVMLYKQIFYWKMKFN